MNVPKDRFWAKVLFKEFIRHFRKLNDEEIVSDIKQSMDDLDDLNDQGTSFGAKMVRWSLERANTPSAEASRANGTKGGRPKSTQGATEGGSPPPTGRPPGNQRGAAAKRPLRNRGPTTKEEFRQFVYEQDLNISLAEDWYAIHEARDWTDNEGGPLKNWKGALTNYCRSRENQ
ncbi:MAG: hypothetical protein MJY89_06360 [Bacteroidales bacterium]|nr:hypothetical protein [Bacteroidales bacterium]